VVGATYDVCVRYTEFWRRMNAVLGERYAQSWAADFCVDELGGRTVDRALKDGEPALQVWRAVCRTIDVPSGLR
jgi:hypothetical protein